MKTKKIGWGEKLLIRAIIRQVFTAGKNNRDEEVCDRVSEELESKIFSLLDNQKKQIVDNLPKTKTEEDDYPETDRENDGFNEAIQEVRGTLEQLDKVEVR